LKSLAYIFIEGSFEDNPNIWIEARRTYTNLLIYICRFLFLI